jgi:hypothetical protein
MAAFIGVPQLWQKAFSSRTPAPHLGQVTMNFHPTTTPLETRSRTFVTRREIL